MTEESDFQRLLHDSKRHMQAGIGQMEQGNPAVALEHFDQAVGLRGKLPWRNDVQSAWLLAAAWINRSDVLRQLNDSGLLPEAIHSLDRGIEAMSQIPLGEKEMYAERMILAWINRGTACGEAGKTDEALMGFAKAEELFVELGSEVSGRRLFLGSMMRVNRARVLLGMGRVWEGFEDSRNAVEILRKLQVSQEVAIAGIKARSIECHALALLLDEPGGPERVGDWIAEATDSAEEALKLVRATGLRDAWVSDLVRYGAKIYRVCQPQFLGEFILEWVGKNGPLSQDKTLVKEMKNELLLARAEVERKVLLFPHDTEFVEKQMRILKALQVGG
jgi:tetratricopeptide (TPR) repeat protein